MPDLQPLTRNETLRRLRAALEDETPLLPALPQALVRVERALQDQSVGARELAEVILEDPGLTAAVLQMANSAAVRTGHAEIRTVTSAIVLLGFQTIRTLAMGLSACSLLRRVSDAEALRPVWQHSLCCAVCAQHLAERAGMETPEEAFVAGLLHDIGKLVLARLAPEPFALVLASVTSGLQAWLEAERSLFGCTHPEVGELLAQRWGFPEEIVQAIGQHETISRKGPPTLPRLVATANRLAHHLFSEAHPAESMLTPADVQTALLQPDEPQSGNAIDETVARLRGQVRDVSKTLDAVVEEWRLSDNRTTPGSSETRYARYDHDRLNFLLSLSERTAAIDDFAELLQKTAEALYLVLDLDYVLLLAPNRQTNRLEMRFGYGPDVENLRDRLDLPLDDTRDLAARAIARRETVAVTPQTLPQFAALGNGNLLGALGTFLAVAVPITVGVRVPACLVVSRDYDSQPFSSEDLSLLRIYSLHLASALQQTHASGGTDLLRKRSPASASATDLAARKQATAEMPRVPPRPPEAPR